jgi:hypothetical protein
MELDPTFDYGFSDLNQKENLVRWRFCELIKTLITLSSDANRQKDIIGVGWVTEEMAIDFNTYFAFPLSQYLENNLLNDVAFNKLEVLDAFFNQRSADEHPDFWDDENLGENTDWSSIRTQAKEILIDLGFADLDIVFEKSQRSETSQDGKPLLIQNTRSVLKRVNS